MKKVLKKLLAVVSSAAILGSATMIPVSAVNGNDIVYNDGDIIIFDDGSADMRIRDKNNFKIRYVIDNDITVTSEYLGLPEEYQVIQADAEKGIYYVKVDSEENLEKFYSYAQQLLDDGKIKNACKQMDYVYQCFYKMLEAKIILKEEDADFNPNSYAGLEDITFTQSETNPKEYHTEMMKSAIPYIGLISAKETVESEPNVESFNIAMAMCAISGHKRTLKTYLIDNTEEEFEVKGDISGDGMLTAYDSAFIANLIAEFSVLGRKVSVETYPNGDYNQDGSISASDAAAIAKYISERSLNNV